MRIQCSKCPIFSSPTRQCQFCSWVKTLINWMVLQQLCLTLLVVFIETKRIEILAKLRLCSSKSFAYQRIRFAKSNYKTASNVLKYLSYIHCLYLFMFNFCRLCLKRICYTLYPMQYSKYSSQLFVVDDILQKSCTEEKSLTAAMRRMMEQCCHCASTTYLQRFYST